MESSGAAPSPDPVRPSNSESGKELSPFCSKCRKLFSSGGASSTTGRAVRRMWRNGLWLSQCEACTASCDRYKKNNRKRKGSKTQGPASNTKATKRLKTANVTGNTIATSNAAAVGVGMLSSSYAGPVGISPFAPSTLGASEHYFGAPYPESQPARTTSLPYALDNPGLLTGILARSTQAARTLDANGFPAVSLGAGVPGPITPSTQDPADSHTLTHTVNNSVVDPGLQDPTEDPNPRISSNANWGPMRLVSSDGVEWTGIL
ncbi:hypothetical protein EJ06DRAFT_553332 [Trichodelitschia bisporula]|uniref:Uncharacterized protein n=1 Tax=Trichodelitschia bisporula TaxID=703511 RepID=A0A6G1I842_9PEZI|nr:hypothetical protein EJ06DRAFT_553332 [Trichodelitschia bisporula]